MESKTPGKGRHFQPRREFPDDTQTLGTLAAPKATGAGAGLPASDEVKSFVHRQSTSVRASIQASLNDVPKWLWQLPLDKRTPEAIIDEVIRQVQHQPNEANLRLAQVVLTELGRDPKITALINGRVTISLLRGIIRSNVQTMPEVPNVP